MDLPPDKAKLLKNYDNEKKWDIICDQEMVHAKDPPAHYLVKLRTYLDPKASRSHRVRFNLHLVIFYQKMRLNDLKFLILTSIKNNIIFYLSILFQRHKK